MKLITATLLGLTSIATFAVNFQCDNIPSRSQGKAELKGSLNQKQGTLEISGDGVYFNSTKREVVPFARISRDNEEDYKFAKFTGGSLFHRFYFSLPKTALQGKNKKFTGYLTYLREGVGGKENIKVSCGLNPSNEVMNEFIKEYGNLITYDHMSEVDKKKVKLISKINDLPKKILNRLTFLDLSLMEGWDTIHQGSSYYVINFENSNETDAFEVRVEGEIQGYIFNVTECNPEECYGWDALYLDAEGKVLYKSF